MRFDPLGNLLLVQVKHKQTQCDVWFTMTAKGRQTATSASRTLASTIDFDSKAQTQTVEQGIQARQLWIAIGSQHAYKFSRFKFAARAATVLQAKHQA